MTSHPLYFAPGRIGAFQGSQSGLRFNLRQVKGGLKAFQKELKP